MEKRKFVSWRRVSTKKQGRSGLGLEAQKDVIDYFVNAKGGEIVADFHETYTGTDLKGCVELRKAIAEAKAAGAVLIIAKTDRFRNTVEALQVYDEMGEGNIMFCDLPTTDKFTLTLFFALAEREALITKIRTKAALKVIQDDIERNGTHTTKKGAVIDKLGNRGANSAENMDKARAASAKSRKDRAMSNFRNTSFATFYSAWRELHGEIRPQDPIEPFCEWISRMGAKTSTGKEMTPARCRAMLTSLRKQGLIEPEAQSESRRMELTLEFDREEAMP